MAEPVQNSPPVESLLGSSIAFLKRYPPFDEMDEAALRLLASHLSLAYFPAGAVVLAPQAGVLRQLYIVQRGRVQLQPVAGYHAAGGDVVTLGPGECFSVYALMEKRAVASPYTAAADTFCYLLPGLIFEELLHRSPRFREFSTDYLRSLLRESRRLLQMHGAGAAAEQHAMNRPLADWVKREPVACAVHTPLREALRRMSVARAGSVVVTGEAGQPLGIFTRHDVLDRVTLAGRALTDAIGAVMTPDPACLDAHASAYDAAMLIAARGIRHVPVTDQGRLVGVVTERDLFAAQQVSVRDVNRTIARASDAQGLVQAGRDIHALVRTLFAQGVAAEPLTRLITTLNDALTGQVISLSARQHDLQGIRWCWLAFGSEGRQEQTVSTDQDNGLIFAADAPDETQVKARLLPFAQDVNRLLDRCGFPLCAGEIMAGNPRWCLSEQGWRKQFDHWVRNTDPEALLNSVIFFDFRALAGDAALARELRGFLNGLVKEALNKSPIAL
ncbi:MAG: CBS domain-containing protein [Betaproteobacteria bacterium]|nr:CBS domain-containing protein [Betaproteobacteria bacterium]